MTIKRMLLTVLALAIALPVFGCASLGNSQQHLRTAIDAKKPAMEKCYAQVLVTDRKAAGQAQLVVHVNDVTGAINRVEWGTTTLKQPGLQKCIDDVLVSTMVEPKPSVYLKVDYTLKFTPAP